MPPPTLTAQQKQVLASASPRAIEIALSQTANANFAQHSWTTPTNAFTTETSTKVKALIQSGPAPHTQPNLNEVIAVSSILHYYDGWSYLAAALKAAIKGETGICRHLSYYAELRAAMSILASGGIGVFDHKHVVVNAAGEIHPIPDGGNSGTHVIAWLALQEWGTFPSSGNLIGDQISAFGHTLTDWTRQFQGTATPSLTGAEWVEQWGIDLNTFSADRNSRNEVSYRVNFNYTSPSQGPYEFRELIQEIWQNTEPASTSFMLLDQFLLRNALEGIYKSKVSPILGQGFQSKINQTCQALGVPQDIADFLCRTTNPQDPSFLTYAATRSGVYDNFHYLEVLSRAYLLLRICSATTKNLANNASVSCNDIAFWWQHVGSARGLWEAGSPPTDVLDLWDTISISLEDFEIWTSSANPNCWHKAHEDIGSSINKLAQTEFAALWGIA